MKKVFLLAASVFVSFGSFAQSAQGTSVSPGAGKAAHGPVMPYQVKPNYQQHTFGKSTAGGTRWYSHVDIVNELMGGTSSSFDWNLFPIWFDSTVLQNFTSGLGAINFISAGQVLDPIHYSYNTDLSLFSGSTIKISASDNYTVDSVFFQGAYVKNLLRPTTIVDTFILSVSPTSAAGTYPHYFYYDEVADPWILNYVGANDTLRGFTILDVDSMERASAVAGVVKWKVPLFDADRQQDSAGFVDITPFTYALPTACSIPAGRGIAVTVTFKSGDVVAIPNIDTFSEYHHFSMWSGEAQGQGQLMPYYYLTNNDRNSSLLMFSDDRARYIPSLMVEGWNSLDFRQEFHDIAAHIVCNTCNPLGLSTVSSQVISGVIAYPNPATDEVNISFTTLENTNATVSVLNAIGQVVATQTVNNTSANVESKATFSTSNLPAGVYMYSVEANGQRSTDRFVVSH